MMRGALDAGGVMVRKYVAGRRAPVLDTGDMTVRGGEDTERPRVGEGHMPRDV